jgi:hypothetical protein
MCKRRDGPFFARFAKIRTVPVFAGILKKLAE